MKSLMQINNLRISFAIVLLLFCLSAGTILNLAQSSRSFPNSVSNPSIKPNGDGRLAGVWTKNDKSYAIVFLSNGNAASIDNRPGTKIKLETGIYRVEGASVKFDWLISGDETENFEADSDNLVLSSSQSSNLSLHLRRLGNGAQAAGYYNQVYQKMLGEAQDFQTNVPTVKAERGAIKLDEFIADSHSADIFANASVYSENARFQWVDAPIRLHETHAGEPGFSCASYNFLPNGRFAYEGWVYGALIDDNFVSEPLNDAQRRDREVSVKHYQMWGKYRVIGGNDAVTGETVELVYDNGSKGSLKVVNGRKYLRHENSNLIFKNYKYFQTEKANRRANGDN